MIAYWMERGFTPEYLSGIPREEKILFAAIARLKQEEQYQMSKDAIIDAITCVIEKMKG